MYRSFRRRIVYNAEIYSGTNYFPGWKPDEKEKKKPEYRYYLCSGFILQSDLVCKVYQPGLKQNGSRANIVQNNMFYFSVLSSNRWRLSITRTAFPSLLGIVFGSTR